MYQAVRELKFGQAELADFIFDSGAFLRKSQSPKGQGFLLTSDKENPNPRLSPFYLNLRTPDNPHPGPVTPELLQMIGHALVIKALKRKLEFGAITGVPSVGTTLAEAMYTEYSKAGEHGYLFTMEKIPDSKEFLFYPDSRYCRDFPVLLIEDAISFGGSTKKAIYAVRKTHCRVRNVLVLLDREQGGVASLLSMGYNVFSIYTIRELLCHWFKGKRITEEELDEYLQYIRSFGNPGPASVVI